MSSHGIQDKRTFPRNFLYLNDYQTNGISDRVVPKGLSNDVKLTNNWTICKSLT